MGGGAPEMTCGLKKKLKLTLRYKTLGRKFKKRNTPQSIVCIDREGRDIYGRPCDVIVFLQCGHTRLRTPRCLH